MKTRKKILIVSEDFSGRELLTQILSEDYQIYFAKDADEAVLRLPKIQPAAIVAELKSGSPAELDALEKLKSKVRPNSAPMIHLIPRAPAKLQIACFKHGADDCLTKPFDAEELLMRVQVRIESSLDRHDLMPNAAVDRLELSNIKIDYEQKQVEIAGELIDVGHVELRILHYLLKNAKRVVCRESLNHYIWGEALPSERALDPHMNSLRKKLKNSGTELKTLYGRGFCLTAPEASA